MQIIRFIWYYSFWIFVRTGLHFYYKKIKVVGYENVPKGVPVIFAANHQNALIDPLLMTTHVYQMTHYLVRADVFKNPIVKRFLNSLNLKPVYRIRDGVNSVKANQKIFKSCFDAFKAKESLMLFPEATHDERRIVKSAKKGIARIVLGAHNQPDGPEDLYIIPVGLTYSGQSIFRSTVIIHYGDAIKTEKLEESTENIDSVKGNYDQALPKYHAALPVEEFDYLDFLFFHDQDAKKEIDYAHINREARIIAKKAPEKEKEALKSTGLKLKSLGINFPFQRKESLTTSYLIITLLSPFALLGVMINLPILLVTKKIMSGIKDKVFTDTIYFGVGLFGLSILWIVYGVITYNYTGSGWHTVYVLMAAPLGLLALGQFNRYKQIITTNRKFNQSETIKGVYSKFKKQIEGLKSYLT